ncbi:MAG: secretin and TonB N-terminal domain-containing protein [Candidatus Omnitrophica bacterium]|nr:secretin and TonB N-terminal domain-containing protein [Candidatus Omnitrophota bacterium]
MKTQMRWMTAVVLLAWGLPACAWAASDTEQKTSSTGDETTASQDNTGSTPPSDTGSPSQSTPAAETAGGGTATPGDGTISVDFKDADIRQVLRIISLKSGVDIVAGPSVEGMVTIKLTNVPWEQALDIILRTYSFAYERKGNVVRVMTKDEVEEQALGTEVYPLSYALAKDVADVIKEMLTDRGKTRFDERTNTLIVTDLPSNLFQLKQVIERLDQATPQVHIESKIVETKLTKDDNLGVDWIDTLKFTINPATLPSTFPFPGGSEFGSIGSTFTPRAGTFDPSDGASMPKGRVPERGGKFTFGTVTLGTSGGTSLDTTLNFLKQRVHTNIISHPTIVTLNNKEATVQVGEDINIPNFQIDPSSGRATVSGFQTRSTGVILKVTPHVNPQNEIVMDLNPEITEVGSTFDTFAQGISFPRFTVQKAKTQVRVKDGDTVVIGGLVKRKVVTTINKVPFLGDLPVVGLIFTQKHDNTDPQQDLLIFLTVRLVKEHRFNQQASMTPSP